MSGFPDWSSAESVARAAGAVRRSSFPAGDEAREESSSRFGRFVREFARPPATGRGRRARKHVVQADHDRVLKISSRFYHVLAVSQSAPLERDQCRRNGARRAPEVPALADLWRKMMRP